MLEGFQFNEATSLAITLGCLAGAGFLQIYSRLQSWRRWKFRVKTRLLEVFGQSWSAGCPIVKDHVLTMRVRLMIREFLTEEAGSAAIEYGLLVAIFASFLIAALVTVGDGLISIFDAVAGNAEEVARCVQVGSNCKK